MKQLLQSYRTGELDLVDIPLPRAAHNQVVVQVRASVISSGTERALVDFARANLLEKARSRPDKIVQVLEKVRTDGIFTTAEAVRAKLDEPAPLGYCTAGVVVDAGVSSGFVAGDRVVTNGPHAEYVRVAHTLAARIPANVDFETAAFTPVAAIALQGIRLASATLGETVVVYGLGVIGLLAVQILRASGCRVIGIDRDPFRLELAAQFGALAINGSQADTVARVTAETGGVGADAVLLTLAASSNEPIHQAALMSRKRGRIVLVGVTGLSLRREDFYEKELSFAVSCSYGPGRYDPSYEQAGHDYPLAYVRWTEKRNFDAVLALMDQGHINVTALITHRFAFAHARAAYDLLQQPAQSLGVVLNYPGDMAPAPPQQVVRFRDTAKHAPVHATAGIIGAGSFSQRTLIPALQAAGFNLQGIASSGGTSAAIAARKFGFAYATTDIDRLLDDSAVDIIFIVTRHGTHAELARRALAAGKHVFVEKPLALNEDDLDQVAYDARSAAGLLTVGFNRRFSPLTQSLQQAVRARATPLALIITVRAGQLPGTHWTRDAKDGGGRLVGEGCHFIDLARAIVGAPIVDAHTAHAAARDGTLRDDIASISMRFADGSIAGINYIAPGSGAYPKERVEAFFDQRTIVIDNWLRLKEYGRAPSFRGLLSRQQKGHVEEMRAWRNAVRAGTTPPIPLDELIEVSRWAIRIARPT